MSKAITNPVPLLQPPGAGLPWWELLVARYIVFPRECRKLDWAASVAQFQEEGAKVLAVWWTIPADRLDERILIRRFAGIEDSSRHWSAAMTVEHLNIVGTGIRQTINTLRQGEVPLEAARIQDVKPSGQATPEAVRCEFVRLLAEAAAGEKVEIPAAPGRGPLYAHPWFGELDAYQWHCLLGLHQGIHRRQMEAIRAGMDGAADKS